MIAVSPYAGEAEVLAAAKGVPLKTDLILLDCIGYTAQMKEKLKALTKKPVILPRTLVARMVCELI